jgi:lysine 6-dehydrogenase
MKVLVLGGGAQGSAAAYDLVRQKSVERVVVADRVVDPPAPFLTPYLGERLELRSVDATDPSSVRVAIRDADADAVLCALPYSFNLQMSQLAVEAGAHYCDLGGNTEIVEKQRGLDEEARAASVSVIPDCGLAPGMVNILAQGGIDALDRVFSVRMFVGGLPENPKPPLNYQIVYSMQGVLDYYTTPSIVLEHGAIATREALSDVEEVRFPEPIGKLEAFHTAGGASTMPFRYHGRIPTLEYKTLRYPGHAELMRAMRELGLFEQTPVQVGRCEVSPRDFFIATVSPQLRRKGSPDLVALRVDVAGEKGGAPKAIRYDVLDHYDPAHKITAMMRTTGYSLSVTALMQMDGRIAHKGVCTPDEVVPVDAYVGELEARGIEVTRTER